MRKLLNLTVIFFAVACDKEEPYDYWASMKGYIMATDTLTGDTGIVWQCPVARVTLSGWNPDSNRYEPDGAYTEFIFTNQWLHLKKSGTRGGSYTVTDSLGALLRIPPSGTFETAQNDDRFVIGVQFARGSTTPWISLRKGDMHNTSHAGRSLYGFTKYRDSATEHFIQFTFTH
jgi:hypothetical protein